MLLPFFFNATATTEIYTLSLHDALPISANRDRRGTVVRTRCRSPRLGVAPAPFRSVGSISEPFDGRHLNRRSCQYEDRKSIRLNSSHSQISYAVFCLKKKNKQHIEANCT